MRSGIASLAVLALAVPPAWAQWGTAETAEEAADGTDTEHLHLPGYEERNARSSLTLEIAPEIVSHGPLRPGTQTSNALDLSLVLATVQPLGDAFEIELDAGATRTIDNGSAASLAAAAELRTRPGASGFSAFMGYSVARDYTGFFDAAEATGQTITTGVRFGRGLGPVEVGFELAPRWSLSSIDADEHFAVNMLGELIAPVIADDVLLILEISGERRWYRDRDPVLLARRKDWRFASYLGLDLAGAFGAETPWLHDLAVGVEWLEVSSNFDNAKASDFALLPAVSIGIGF
ncbi:MAG TPA: hypothetical protein VM662_16370 [Sphingomonas sp.]|nr:hypothetical protein [Sphingomonas sp.]